MKSRQRLCVIIGLAVMFSSEMVETGEARYSRSYRSDRFATAVIRARICR